MQLGAERFKNLEPQLTKETGRSLFLFSVICVFPCAPLFTWLLARRLTGGCPSKPGLIVLNAFTLEI